jgi:S1-C subfamily serine protease
MDPRPFYRAMGLGLMAISIVFPFYALAADLTKLRDQALAPVVQLNRTCSATVIHSDRDETSGEVTTLVLTAKHCVDGETNRLHTIYIPIYDKANRLVREDAWKVKVHGTFYKHDLALLRVVDTATLFPVVAKLAAKDVALVEGEPTTVVGYPYGFGRTKTAGEFGNRESIPFPDRSKDTEYFRATPGVAGGNSGGALFHETASGDFELIGVTSAGFDVGHINYFVPIDAIREYVDMVTKPVTTTAAR